MKHTFLKPNKLKSGKRPARLKDHQLIIKCDPEKGRVYDIIFPANEIDWSNLYQTNTQYCVLSY